VRGVATRYRVPVVRRVDSLWTACGRSVDRLAGRWPPCSSLERWACESTEEAADIGLRRLVLARFSPFRRRSVLRAFRIANEGALVRGLARWPFQADGQLLGGGAKTLLASSARGEGWLSPGGLKCTRASGSHAGYARGLSDRPVCAGNGSKGAGFRHLVHNAQVSPELTVI
jgi:hypothetical protein